MLPPVHWPSFRGVRAHQGVYRPAIMTLTLLATLVHCQAERPPFHASDGGASGGTAGAGGSSILTDAGCEGPPELDAGGLCANEVVEIRTTKPNLYFVLDASLSMSEPLDSQQTKFEAATLAIQRMLADIGSKVRYGAAMFPTVDSEDQCVPGAEVFETQEGDVLGCDVGLGATLRTLLLTLEQRQVSGGTPISATLAAVAPILAELPGDTVVILLTDGAPNCNPATTCDSSECLPDLARVPFEDATCGVEISCCDADVIGPGASVNCVDARASEDEVTKLADVGVSTYVVGMPGSELFAAVLDRMAEAGGTARGTSPKYYSVSALAELQEVLSNIGEVVAASCTVKLGDPAPDLDLINVYLDQAPVSMDEADGWVWVDEYTIELRGRACRRIEDGTASRVQIVAGCPTIVE